MEKPPALYIVAEATASCYFLLAGALVYAPIGDQGPDWGAVSVVEALDLVPPRVIDALRVLTPAQAVIPGEPVSGAATEQASDLSPGLPEPSRIPPMPRIAQPRDPGLGAVLASVSPRPRTIGEASAQLRALADSWEALG